MTWWRRLGGPDAVSWPLFWVTFAASTLAQFALPPLPIPFWVRVVSITVAQIAQVERLLTETGSDRTKLLAYFGVETLAEITGADYPRVVRSLEKRRAA